MTAQYVSLAEAAELVQDGMTIAFGGMTVYRRPLAFVRALLRRSPRPKGLTLACFTAGIESDLLIGAGCVAAIRSVYVGLEAFGFAPMFTQAVHAGAIKMIDETEASFSLGLRAQAAGVGFLPSKAWLGTDLPALRPDVRTVEDPYSGELLMAFPAIGCDIAILHGLAADHIGTVLINNNLGVDFELCYASSAVIATVERRVERLERTTIGSLIPAPGVDVIAVVERGAAPTSCYPDYPVSGREFMRYVDACNNGKFEDYLTEFIADAD